MPTQLDHISLGHVGGGKWPGDEAKTMPCILQHYYKSALTVHATLVTCLWHNLDPELEWAADLSHSINNYVNGSRYTSQGC